MTVFPTVATNPVLQLWCERSNAAISARSMTAPAPLTGHVFEWGIGEVDVARVKAVATMPGRVFLRTQILISEMIERPWSDYPWHFSNVARLLENPLYQIPVSPPMFQTSILTAHMSFARETFYNMCPIHAPLSAAKTRTANPYFRF
jgi:hypothetical protein